MASLSGAFAFGHTVPRASLASGIEQPKSRETFETRCGIADATSNFQRTQSHHRSRQPARLCYETRITSASIGVRLKKYSPRCSRISYGPVRADPPHPAQRCHFARSVGPSSPDIVAPAKRRTPHDCRCPESRKERFWSQAHREPGSVATRALRGGLIMPTEWSHGQVHLARELTVCRIDFRHFVVLR